MRKKFAKKIILRKKIPKNNPKSSRRTSNLEEQMWNLEE